MGTEDQASLEADIKVHGLRDPIVTFDGMILDGWHRFRCCENLGIPPVLKPLGEGVDPVAFVQSVNLLRRHLTGSQRAAAVTACSTWAQSGENQHTRGGEVAASPTVAQMAKTAEVSPRTIQQAKQAQKSGLGDAVRDGKVTAERAAELAKLPEPERQAAMAAPKAPKAKMVAAPGRRDSRIADLEFEVSDLKERLAEMADLLQSAQTDNESMARILDAEDLRAAYNKEVHRFQELARVVQSRNNGLLNENSDLMGRLKSALRKIERLENKGNPPVEDEPELETREDEPTFEEVLP
jgi:FtsZ-binding cell division protein ZapB